MMMMSQSVSQSRSLQISQSLTYGDLAEEVQSLGVEFSSESPVWSQG